MKETCGPNYQRAMKMFHVDTDGVARVFAAGFISGQAEKIKLGACQAAMFRPSPERLDTIAETAHNVCQIYGLHTRIVDDEVWIYRLEVAEMIDKLQDRPTLQVNSKEWHFIRGALTGVPATDIDYCFHERSAFMEPCDKIFDRCCQLTPDCARLAGHDGKCDEMPF